MNKDEELNLPEKDTSEKEKSFSKDDSDFVEEVCQTDAEKATTDQKEANKIFKI